MSSHMLSPDSQSILLLCGTLGQDRTACPKPLSPAEFHRLALWMKSNDMRPNELLLPGFIDKLKAFNDAKIDLNRIKSLLNRGGALAFSVEAWTNRGLWILSVVDESYPRRWRDRLGHNAPPLIYGAGNRDLLSKGGLAIIGSRDVDEVGTDVTRTVAKMGAINGIQIISGGARGVDSEAMQAALTNGGCVAGVLADSLSRESVSV